MWICFKFWPMKNISENYNPIRVWLWIAYKFIENNCRLQVFSEDIQTQKRYPISPWQNKYSDLKTIWHIKPKFFLWTKLRKNLLPAKYLIYVAVDLMAKLIIWTTENYHFPFIKWSWLNDLQLSIYLAITSGRYCATRSIYLVNFYSKWHSRQKITATISKTFLDSNV